MMLSRKEIEELLRAVALTKDKEINCEQCLALVAEYAERKLAGLHVEDSLRAVEHHLELCPECREEYQALQRALTDLES